MEDLVIGRNKIGENHPCYVIAEIGVNHEGSFERAKEMVNAAVLAGANAVKFQIVLADTLYPESNREGNEFYDLFKQAELTREEFIGLKALADELDTDCFASFNCNYGVDVSEEFDAPAYKVASTQLTNLPMIHYLATKGKPVIISTGMSTTSDVDNAVKTLLDAGNNQIAILHCVSNYPTLPEQVNLRAMQNLFRYGFQVGFSDHTIGNLAAVGAVALGGRIIEKHFTFDKTRPGFDHRLSCEPNEFCSLVDSIREAEQMLGSVTRQVYDFEQFARDNYSVKLVAAETIRQGQVITDDMIVATRMKEGVTGDMWRKLIGKKSKRTIEKGGPVVWGDLD